MERKTKKVQLLKCACGEKELSGKKKRHVEYLHTHIRRGHFREHSMQQCIENWPLFKVYARA